MKRLGVHRRWNKEFLIKELACRIPELAGLSAERLAESLSGYAEDKAKYLRFSAGDSDLEFRDAIFGLEFYAPLPLRRAEHALYSGVRSDFDEFHSTALHWTLQRLLYIGRNIAALRTSNVRGTALRDVTETLAMAYSLGWNEAADRIGSWTLQLLPLGMCWSKDDWDPRWEKRREPFARFAITLYADFSGVALPEMPAHPYEAPPYDALLANWRNPDPAVLTEPLLAACDWHTHECMYSRSDKPSKNVDFINDCLMGWPVEVHMVYRLRERLGLALPGVLDHPLMQTPFGPYRPPAPMPADEMLDRLMERAFSEIPGLRALVEPAIKGR